MHEAMKAGEVREMEGQVREKFWRLRRVSESQREAKEDEGGMVRTRRGGRRYRAPSGICRSNSWSVSSATREQKRFNAQGEAVDEVEHDEDQDDGL